jgi:hypothetical protein
MQGYPQHATPYFTSGVKGLRQALLLEYMEFNLIAIGSQSNLITTADMYNNIRIAVIKTGFSYSIVNPLYLSSVLTGVNLQGTKKVYHDEILSLPSLAFSTGNYNSPSTKVIKRRITLKERIDCFSNNSSGVGVAWDTNGVDFDVNFVSDSLVPPDPTISMSCRIWFRYL